MPNTPDYRRRTRVNNVTTRVTSERIPMASAAAPYRTTGNHYLNLQFQKST